MDHVLMMILSDVRGLSPITNIRTLSSLDSESAFTCDDEVEDSPYCDDKLEDQVLGGAGPIGRVSQNSSQPPPPCNAPHH